MQATIREVVKPILALRDCDFAVAIERYPITVICRMIGIDAEDVDTFKDGRWPGSGLQPRPAVLPHLNEIIGKMFRYVDDLLAGRQALKESLRISCRRSSSSPTRAKRSLVKSCAACSSCCSALDSTRRRTSSFFSCI